MNFFMIKSITQTYGNCIWNYDDKDFLKLVLMSKKERKQKLNYSPFDSYTEY